MKVLVVTNMYPTPPEPWFGVFVEDAVNATRRRGVEVEVYAFDGRADRRAYARAVGAIRARLKNGDVDIVHAHYGLSGAVACAQRRVPVVTTFHGSDTGYVRWQGLLSWIVARQTTPVFVSTDAARRLRLPGSHVIPPGIDLDLFRPLDRRTARGRLGWDDRPRVLLPGSRTNPVKGVELFDAVMRIVRGAVPHVAVESLEGRPRSEVAWVLNAVDAVLMTSVSEGAPLTIKEALACNTPVVSVPVGDVADVIDGLPGCGVVDRDPALLAEATVRALKAGRDEALRRRAREYSNERAASELLEVYEEAMRK